MSYLYLASPYSKYSAGLDAAFEEAAKAVGRLASVNIIVYSPIVHCHHPAQLEGLASDFQAWQKHNEVMMEAAWAMILYQMDGWDTSEGIRHEIDYFSKKRKSIYALTPEECFAPSRKILFQHFQGKAVERNRVIGLETP